MEQQFSHILRLQTFNGIPQSLQVDHVKGPAQTHNAVVLLVQATMSRVAD
jgi:hypothetical protein